MKSNSLFNEQIHLQDAELFQDLTAAEIDALGEQMPDKEVGAGTVFYSPEHPTEVLLFLKKVASGCFTFRLEARLSRLQPSNRELSSER